jgi:hypothetical protein
MKEDLIKLLDKYYSGETTTEEEVYLKTEILASEETLPEMDIFSYYSSGTILPEDIEDSLFSGIKEKPGGKRIRFKVFSLSAAACILVLVTLFTGYLRQQKTEHKINTIEQALTLVSGSLQPEEEPEMFVLWIDNNVEVIIN